MNILAIVWISAAILALIPVMLLLHASLPIFSLLFLVIPLVEMVRTSDARLIGIRSIHWKEYLKYTGINLALLLALMAAFEPWSHTYQMLVERALSSSSTDATFGWLVQYSGIGGWSGMLAYSALVSLFAEELCFRGWLLQKLKKRMGEKKAIALQAAIFSLPQCLAAFLLPPLQGILYVLVYSWLAIGCVGGWAASRTQSIWPSLTSAIICNLVLCALMV